MPDITNKTSDETIDFGFETIARAEKQARVAGVFSSVASSYDIMNDLMSLGVHRLWKEALIDWLAPQPNQTLVDIAGGTGDIACRFLERGGGHTHIIDINPDMLAAGQKRHALQDVANRLSWVEGNAESLPLPAASTERVVIAFGLRNVTDRVATLKEAWRVLKPGGRFCCLEFAPVDDLVLSRFYDFWSFQILPLLGRYIARDEVAYRYLAESIRCFPSPEELAAMLSEAGFAQIRLRRLSGGIAVIHSGWKLD